MAKGTACPYDCLNQIKLGFKPLIQERINGNIFEVMGSGLYRTSDSMGRMHNYNGLIVKDMANGVVCLIRYSEIYQHYYNYSMFGEKL